MTFFYGLQHRRLSVKKAHADGTNRRKIEELRAQSGSWPNCGNKGGPGQYVTQVSWFWTPDIRSCRPQPSLSLERAKKMEDL
jgi:hypothetical protein